jgi:O-antigen biosynthesis protein WbqP
MKRLFDLFLVILLGIIVFIPSLIIAILIKLDSKGPILYWSKRVGRNNELFQMPKFRSMRTGTPVVATHLLTNPETHLTSFGKILRKTSLDEIPQLLTILNGHMSFVGPRPALFNQLELIELRTSNQVHKLVPGITGWAQVNGRDEISIEQKVFLDVEYSIRKSFLFDLFIIFKTIWIVLRSKDISH